jgi:ubiquitin C-terminal hydrolase
MVVGITNIGNTCYVNTFLQCLGSIQVVRDHLKKIETSGKNVATLTGKILTLIEGSGNPLEAKVVRVILKQLGAYTPSYLSLTEGDQHDMTELYGWWMDKIHQDLQTAGAGAGAAPRAWFKPRDDWDPFHKMCLTTWEGFHKSSRNLDWAMLYEGLLVQQVQCLKCRRCFHNPEPFASITLDIPEGAGSLTECFQTFFTPEKLNEWKCDHCRKETPAEKVVRIWKAPPLLTVVLKRFQGSGILSKNNTPIQLPMSFHFLPNMELCPDAAGGGSGSGSGSKEVSYRLMAVGNHYGGIHGGHYTATVCRGGKWWLIDDDDVRPLDSGVPIATERAYMAFYERGP